MSCADPTRENLVIGGGLAGAMAALRLAAAGRDVVLVEKERNDSHKVCGEFLSPEAVAYLHQAGVDPLLLGATAIEQLRFAVKKRVIETRLPFRALSISRCVLDAALLARAAEAGCEIRRGVTASRLSLSGNGFAVTFADDTAAQVRNVFLATGKHDLRGWNRPHGKQGDLVGFKMHWRLRPEETYALRGFMDLFLFEGGYGGLSLVENGTANLCLVVRRSRLLRLGGWLQIVSGLIEENDLLAQRLCGAHAQWERPLAISSIPYGYIANTDDGIWRVGDQAAVIPSFTGDGMAIALHSGALAAEMCLAGKSPDVHTSMLRGQLSSGMSLAILLSRAMISSIGRELAPAWMATLPRAVQWIARSTRIPGSALRFETTPQEQPCP